MIEPLARCLALPYTTETLQLGLGFLVWFRGHCTEVVKPAMIVFSRESGSIKTQQAPGQGTGAVCDKRLASLCIHRATAVYSCPQLLPSRLSQVPGRYGLIATPVQTSVPALCFGG